MQKIYLIFQILLLSNLSLLAQNTSTTGQINSSGTILTAVPYLMINPDIAAMGIGQTGIATQSNPLGSILNPAKMAFDKKGIASATSYMPWLRALYMNMQYFASATQVRWGEKHCVSVQSRQFRLNDINYYGIDGIFVGTFQIRETALGLAYAYKLNEHFSVGTSLSWINSPIIPMASPGRTLAGGMSGYYQNQVKKEKWEANYSAGLSISNIGPKIQYGGYPNSLNFLPANLGLGTAARFRILKYLLINPAIDFNKLLVQSPQSVQNPKSTLMSILGSGFDAQGGMKEELQEWIVSGGLEIGAFLPFNKTESVYFQPLVRAGYFSEAENKGNRKFVTLGVGGNLVIKHLIMSMNLAYISPTIPNHPLSNTWGASGNLGYLF